MKASIFINDEEWNKLIQDAAEQFDEVTLSRGFRYYKQGQVVEMSVTTSQTIEALVRGSANYEVYIQPNALSLSDCGCPAKKPCKHIAAVLMKWAAEQGRSVAALANAQASRNIAASVAAKQQTIPAPPYLGSQTTGLQQKAELFSGVAINQMSILEWHERFQYHTASLERETRNSAYAKQALELIFNYPVNSSPTLEQVYGLHAHLFVLKKLLEPVKMPGSPAGLSSHLGYFTQLAVSELDQAILLSLDYKYKAPLETGTEYNKESWIKPTLAYLRSEMLIEPKGRFYYYQYYLKWLEEWIIHPLTYTDQPLADCYKEELNAVEQAGQALGDSLSRYPWLMVQVRLYAKIGDDEHAWGLLSNAAEQYGTQAGELYSILTSIRSTENWPRLTSWLLQLGSFVQNGRLSELDEYFKFWEEAASHDPAAEKLMWETLYAMLPSAGWYYEQKLYQHERWQEWIDFQLSMGTDPLDFRATELQRIEKSEPRLLLPFYHQAVERYVMHKNRDSYKSAVKLLKRLSKLYTKLKMQDRWEQFFNAFMSRHSRLRALQEELRKGKLIS